MILHEGDYVSFGELPMYGIVLRVNPSAATCLVFIIGSPESWWYNVGQLQLVSRANESRTVQ